LDKTGLINYLNERLGGYPDTREASSIAGILADYLLADSTANLHERADVCVERVRKGEPVQYVTGNTWFYDLQLGVTPAVLIPRPETEELVEWILDDYRNQLIPSEPEILDIGTGSGCIALALKKNIATCHIAAIDISADALCVAMSNAVTNEVMIEFRLYDILKEELERTFDVIVSNPPYISRDELQMLSKQVRDYEPVLALCPDPDDALVFYRRLAELGKTHLNTNGRMYLELNEFRAQEIKALFDTAGYETELRKDMQDKWRMLCVRIVR
jgi:release factor glutamine methyltransferase